MRYYLGRGGWTAFLEDATWFWTRHGAEKKAVERTLLMATDPDGSLGELSVRSLSECRAALTKD